MDEIEQLAGEKPDFVFNLVESISNKGELCYFIPALLNMRSIPYTGNPLEAMFITTSKALSYKIMLQENISTPRTCFPSQHGMLEPGKKYIIKLPEDPLLRYDDLFKQLENEFSIFNDTILVDEIN